MLEENVIYFFEQEEKQEQLRAVLSSWKGTPFRHRCGVKGKGTDCIFFIARVLEELGVLKLRPKMIPDYSKDWHLHNTREILLEAVGVHLKTVEVGTKYPMVGDLLFFHYGKAASHAAIFCDGHIYHSITNVGVRSTPLCDRVWRSRLKYGRRLLAK